MANEELIADLVARIRTVYDDAGAKKADAAVKGLSKSLDDQTKGPSSRFAAAQQLIQNKLQGFAGSSNVVTKGLGDLSKAGVVSGEALATGLAGGAVVAAAAVAKLASDGIGKFVSLTAEIRGFQRVAGTSAEDSSKLVGAMHLLGIEPEVAGKAIGILSRNIEQHAQKLEADGIQIAKNKDGNTDLIGTLFNVADAYNASTDQAKKNTIALDAFGRGGLALIPILQRGRDGIEELFKATGRSGLIFDQAALERGRQFALAGKELKESFTGLEISVGERLVPALTTAAKRASEIIDDLNHAASIKLPGGTTVGDDVGKALNQTFNPFAQAKGLADLISKGSGLSAVLGVLHGKQKDASSSADQLKATDEDLAAAEQEAARQADVQAKAIDAVVAAQSDLIDAELGALGASDRVARANDDVTDKTAAYAKALRETGAASRQTHDAGLDLNEALHAQQQAYVQLGEANAKAIIDQQEAAGATLDAQQKNDILRAELEKVANTTSGPLHESLDALIGQLKTADENSDIVINFGTKGLQDTIGGVQTLLANLSQVPRAEQIKFANALPVGAPHAAGGPVLPGIAYPVGEVGPEIFVPGVPGTIIPNSALVGGDGGVAAAAGIAGAGLAELVAAIERVAGRPVVVMVGETELARTIAAPVTIAQATSRGARRR